MRAVLPIAVGMVLSLSPPALAQYLTLGGDSDMDACPSMGQVVGLKTNGDNFLAVRTGPGTSHRKVDELHTGNAVYICLHSGAWYGVVYGRGGDCGVSSPIASRKAYQGPCKSGWVHQNFIHVTAG